jgi:sugar lactone lactonase YvrE
MSKRESWPLATAAALVVAVVCAGAATAGGQATQAGSGYKQVGAWGKTGTANGQFATSGGGIAVDKAGNVYVADSDNARVQVFSAKGGFLRKWGSPGTGDGQFGIAADIAIAPDGTVLVADDPNSRYEAFSSSGAFQATLAAPTGELARGVAVDPDGNVLGAIEGSGFSGFHRFAKTATGWDAAGSLVGRGVPAANDIEASPDGSIYVTRRTADPASAWIQRYSADGRPSGTIKQSVPDAGRGIAVDLDCNVLASDSGDNVGRFSKYSPTGKKLASAQLPYFVRDLAVGPRGDVYALIQSGGVVHLVENRSPGVARVSPGVVSGGVAKLKYTLTGVACPAQIDATASLTGAGISGKANVKVAAGKTTVISIPVKGKGTATFKIVLKTNGRPTTQIATVKVG